MKPRHKAAFTPPEETTWHGTRRQRSPQHRVIQSARQTTAPQGQGTKKLQGERRQQVV